MPYLQLTDARIWYELTGSGKDTLLFGHGLLYDHQMFDAQVEVLKQEYRCVRFDFRAHGESSNEGGEFTIDQLTADTVQLIQDLGLGPCHYIGFSMGGFVGLRLAGRYPGLISSLTLIDTSAEAEPQENLPGYKMLLVMARIFGLKPVAGQVMKIMFGSKFLNDPDRKDLKNKWKNIFTGNEKKYAIQSVHAVIERDSVIQLLPEISAPTQILVGDKDIATTPEKAHRMKSEIPNSELHFIPDSGHSSPIEEPGIVTLLLKEFLNKTALKSPPPA